MSGGFVDSVGASATTIKNAVWNALTSAHTTAGSFGVLLKDELAKFGTLVNTGGTATIGAIFGDFANSSLVVRLNAIKTVVDAIPTSSSGKQTQYSFDNGLITVAPSTTVEWIPAAGQSLDLQFFTITFISNNSEYIWFSGDSGTTYLQTKFPLNSANDWYKFYGWAGDSVNRIKLVTSAETGNREYWTSVRLWNEEA